MIKGVIFDIGGVMATMDVDALLAGWGSLGVDLRGLNDAMYRGNDDTALIGRVSAEEWWRSTVAPRLGLDAAALERFLADLGRWWSWDGELDALLRSCRPRFRTAFLTNAWSDMRHLLAVRGWLDAADELVNSAEEGVAKPEERIYRIALDRLGVEPSEAVFVDDLEENVAAARAIGITGIRHRTTPQTLHRLHELGIGDPPT